MTSISVKCVGCGAKKKLENEEAAEQPFCEQCGMPMIAEQVELDTRR